MPGVEIDESGWPIVLVHWSGVATDEDLGEFLGCMDAWLGKGQKFGLLVDSRQAKGLSSKQRGMVTQHMKANSEKTKMLLVHAILLGNRIQRALYFAMNMLFPMPFNNKVFESPEEARDWLEKQLAPPKFPAII